MLDFEGLNNVLKNKNVIEVKDVSQQISKEIFAVVTYHLQGIINQLWKASMSFGYDDQEAIRKEINELYSLISGLGLIPSGERYLDKKLELLVMLRNGLTVA